VVTDDRGQRQLPGFSRSVHTYNVRGTDTSRAMA